MHILSIAAQRPAALRRARRIQPCYSWRRRGQQNWPFVHNIAALLTLIEKSGIALPEEIRAAAGLTDYAVMARYPGTAEAVDEQEYKDALKMADAVFSWASDIIGKVS